MEIKEVKTKIKETMEEPVAIMLLGPPGIGKSQAVKQAAMEYATEQGLEFVESWQVYELFSEIIENPENYFVFMDFRLTEIEPSDLIGIPDRTNGYTEYLPNKWAVAMSRTKGILFLDELTNVQRPDVLSVAYKLILDKQVGSVYLENTKIIAAGNSDKHSSIANPLPAPLLNRMAIIEMETPLKQWAQYIFEKHGEKANDVIAFLLTNTELYMQLPKESEGWEPFPTPRSWETVIQTSLDPEFLVGKSAGLKFRAYQRIKPPPLETLLNNPEMFSTLNRDKQYLSVMSLISDFMNRQKITKKHLLLMNSIAGVSEEFLAMIVSLLPEKIKKRVFSKIISSNKFDDSELLDKLADMGSIIESFQDW